MNHQLVLGAALAAVLASGITSPAYAAGGKEKCYGVAAAGQNDCSNLSNTHSCAGMAKINNSLVEWKLVAKGTCISLGGLSEKQAKAKFAAEKKA
jgi:uncharacterized membrane protein